MPDQKLLDEVKKFLAQYTHGFDTSDGLAIAALYHVPSVSVRGDGSVHCFQSKDELQRFFQGVAEGYQREGDLAPSRYRDLTVQPIGGRSALATMTWLMELKDGSVLRQWRQSYNLLRVDGRWQIFVSTFHLD